MLADITSGKYFGEIAFTAMVKKLLEVRGKKDPRIIYLLSDPKKRLRFIPSHTINKLKRERAVCVMDFIMTFHNQALEFASFSISDFEKRKNIQDATPTSKSSGQEPPEKVKIQSAQ